MAYLLVFKEEVFKYEEICEDTFQRAKQNPVYKLDSWLDSPWEGGAYEALEHAVSNTCT